MQVCVLKSEMGLTEVAEVLLQLRPQYNLDTLINQIRAQQKQGYQIAYVKSDNQVLCVAGFVVGDKLAWGKHVYIDDLATNENCRSEGIGSLMIEWFKSYCKNNGYAQLHLDSGVQKFAAHRFYLNNRFNIASHHFSITNIAANESC
jgi:GNAT superfamily N-acetyltransferase